MFCCTSPSGHSPLSTQQRKSWTCFETKFIPFCCASLLGPSPALPQKKTRTWIADNIDSVFLYIPVPSPLSHIKKGKLESGDEIKCLLFHTKKKTRTWRWDKPYSNLTSNMCFVWTWRWDKINSILMYISAWPLPHCHPQKMKTWTCSSDETLSFDIFL